MTSFRREVSLKAENEGFLGFRVSREHVVPPLLKRHPQGCFIHAVEANSPASKAHLVDGDYIVSINGRDVTKSSHQQVVELLKENSVVQLVIECYALVYLQTTNIVLHKLRNGRLYRREYHLSPDTTKIVWFSRHKPAREACIFTGDIAEVRPGHKTTSFQREISALKESDKGKLIDDCCFSIIFGEALDVQDLIADHPVTASAFILAGDFFKQRTRLAELNSISFDEEKNIRDNWLKQTFMMADLNNDQQLSLDEVQKLLYSLNVSIPKSILKKKFYDADQDKKGSEGYGKLDYKEFAQFYKALLVRPEIGSIMLRYGQAALSHRPSGVDTFDDVTLSKSQLKIFFEIEQEEDIDEETASELIQTFESARNDGLMGIDGFTNLLNSLRNAAFNPIHRNKIYHDMTQPLSHYFIASSHNTYLMEDQLYGPSDVEAYIRSLRSGCRCIELDCWDGDNDEPVIYHGHTLTSKILLKDVIDACAEYAFIASEYPLIFSIENHLSLPQQEKLAMYMKQAFGERLAVIPITTDPMPSPEELKGKVLIKGKVAPPSSQDAELSEDDEAGEALIEASKTKLKGPPKAVRNHVKRNAKKAASHHKVKVAKSFSDIVSLAGVKYRGPETLQAAMKEQLAMQMSSFGEKKAELLATEEQYTNSFIRRNAKQLARVYPAGLRVTSSNYSPIPMFNAGCQIVALNYQTMSEPMHVYLGKFADNGGCGYLLKPQYMRDVSTHFNPHDPATMSEADFRTLSLTICSAQQLPKPLKGGRKTLRGEVIDPYVIVHVDGVPADSYQVATKTINNNGFNPVWGETFKFDLRCPELALVSFQVFDSDLTNGDDLVAQATIPFTSLQQGYRNVHLYTANNKKISGASIFVKIDVDRHGTSRNTTHEASPLRSKTLKVDPMRVVVGIPEIDAMFNNTPVAAINARRKKLDTALRKFKSAVGIQGKTSPAQMFQKLAAWCQNEGVSVFVKPYANKGGEVLALLPSVQDDSSFSHTALAKCFVAYDELVAAMLQIFMTNEQIQQHYRAVLTFFKELSKKDKFEEAAKQCGLPPKKWEKSRLAFNAKLASIREEVRGVNQDLTLLKVLYKAADECFGETA